ncbi:hypothetical protein [Candidatus Mycobacterium methanotrophicum]|uniref:Uncharacterized protein n=1 Tax=Candidatus Mycobacterium methanotrophicum TaxID=2943498 RepID=A0ABY4QIW0_9MYCO|nr:hypothetical protein [Candidatus Mycobacterium methanotrophicum]UQX09931.1 hypothetical protein M5I08_16990 [Candidatus Mycobacterium methanotrophicum]
MPTVIGVSFAKAFYEPPISCRQPKQPGDQLAFDDLDGWRLHAIITNVTA